MSTFYPVLYNKRGRIHCYWCKQDEQERTGPWAITREYLIDEDRRVPVCYNHSDIPRQDHIKQLQAKAAQ